ncbi:MAG: hypothetical protein ACJ8CB_24790 [Ktedonobacteraceae bacterium]
MKKRKFSVRRHTMATAEAQRRWDQAYQCLVRWSIVTRGSPSKSPIDRRAVMRVAMYVRVSIQRQAQTQTIEQQIDLLRQRS